MHNSTHNQTPLFPQIYELLAASTSERSKWIKHITEASNPHKSKDGMSKTKVSKDNMSKTKVSKDTMSKTKVSKDDMSKTKVSKV